MIIGVNSLYLYANKIMQIVMKRAYILMAEGFETIEALTPMDVLVRSGVEVTLLSISQSCEVRSAQGVTVLTDGLLLTTDMSDGDAVVLPGGYPGYKNLAESSEVLRVVSDYYNRGKIVAAICGAPTAIAAAGIGFGSEITAHTSVANELTDYRVSSADVVCSDNLITGKGAGLSLPFSLAIAEALTSPETVADVKSKMEL